MASAWLRHTSFVLNVTVPPSGIASRALIAKFSSAFSN
jgi:hypothetical protein